MSEKDEGIFHSLKSLAKNSINLLEKCQKPDKKGNNLRFIFRICKNHAVLCHWLCSHGSDRISHQTSFHPCKQYFAWLKRIILFFHYNARKKKKKKKKKTYHEKSKKQKKHNILNDLRELHTKRKHRYDQQT
eukprot:TRINITY_DN11374_c0_g1_i5.p2 TRINITY_DN11374_c0_g1~~TRINITY_DN11374_c0_g1_i5.p2  ORF type:complete len:144 (-),score=23.09 TRINITY_DN11374_c0_g1_i5:18-413(-)